MNKYFSSISNSIIIYSGTSIKLKQKHLIAFIIFLYRCLLEYTSYLFFVTVFIKNEKILNASLFFNINRTLPVFFSIARKVKRLAVCKYSDVYW